MHAVSRAALCLAALAIPAAIVVAQPGDAPRKPMRHAPPQTKAEAEAQAMALFDRIDADHDGSVTRAEADAALSRMHARMAEKMKGWRDARFARMDANKDGSISRSEYDAAGAERPRLAMRDAPTPPGPGHDGVAPPPPPHPPMMAMRGMGRGRMGDAMMTGPMFDRIDTDHDGRISRAEAKAVADIHFGMGEKHEREEKTER